MRNSKTFSVLFWLKKIAEKENNQIPIYARVTVDGLRADISLKRTSTEIDWCIKSRRLNPRLASSKNINSYLDNPYTLKIIPVA